MLAGVLGPTCGTIRVCGHDLIEAPLAARRCLGYVAEDAPLYAEMTPRHYLLYRSELKGVDRRQREQAVRNAVEDAACQEILDMRIQSLSKGHRQRVGLADALIARPPVILLDEPTAGLDPNHARDFRDLIGKLREHHAILISTPVPAEVEALCTSVLIMHEGRLMAAGAVEALRAKDNRAEIELVLRDLDLRATFVIAGCGWQLCSNEHPTATGTTRIRARFAAPGTNTDEAVERLVSALATAGIGIRSVQRVATSLATVFSQLTRSDNGAQS
jgi:ABC-2 type transport system ATP-binding protein